MQLKSNSPVGIALALSIAVNVCSAQPIEIRSPDGEISVNLAVDASGHLTYEVKCRDQIVVEPSSVGIIVDGQDLGTNAVTGAPVLRDINETYPTRGVHNTATNHCREAIVKVTGGPKTPWTLEVRVFNDGVAYRYRVPERGRHVINGEVTEWKVPAGSMAFFQDNSRQDYETVWKSDRVGDIKLKDGLALMCPLTFKLAGGGYALITEANLINYSDMELQPVAGNGFRACFHNDNGGWTNRDEIVSPWRVTLVASDLNTLVNSDMLRNLCPPPPPELAQAVWIKPGRCTWHWMVSRGPKWEQQRQWVDWTRQLGFEYYLIDDGWVRWNANGREAWDCLKEAVDYAASQNVKIWIWLNSRDIPVATSRQAWFEKAKSIGVAGLKIDFPQPPNTEWVQWYDSVLRDAARANLMLDFHGALKPSGRERTWPNELTREAIRGREHKIPDLLHEAILPFTRYVQGPADFTPTEFRADKLQGSTWPRELGQAIVYTSPLLCYSGSPEDYLKSDALDIIKAIPSTWDETVVLPGSEIGETAAFARRKGDEWFIGVINGENPRTLKINLSFLGAGNYTVDKIADAPERFDAWVRTKDTVTSASSFNADLRAGGGLVARIYKATQRP
jgi:alpha-glucosidase